MQNEKAMICHVIKWVQIFFRRTCTLAYSEKCKRCCFYGSNERGKAHAINGLRQLSQPAFTRSKSTQETLGSPNYLQRTTVYYSATH